MTSLSIFKRMLIILVFAQVGDEVLAAKSHKQVPNPDVGRMMTDKIRAATPEQLRKGQIQASKKLQGNFARAMSILSKKSAKEIPMEVRESAKQILLAVKSGQMSSSFDASLPGILVHLPSRATPAQQLATIINDVTPRAPVELRAPLQGVMDFVKTNVAGVNGVLGRVINGTPSLLNGVVSSFANTLGGVNGAVNGSLDSLNNMVGGLLSGLPISGLLPGGGGGGGLLGGATGGLLGGGGGLGGSGGIGGILGGGGGTGTGTGGGGGGGILGGGGGGILG